MAGLPSGATDLFNPVSGTPSFTSSLGITTANTPSGTDVLTITGTDSRVPEGGSRNTMPTLQVLTPAQALPLVQSQIQNFQSSGVLTGGQANSLSVKLAHAIDQLNAARPGTACNQLKAFVNEVNAYVSAGILTPAQASALLGGPLGINAIMAAIPC